MYSSALNKTYEGNFVTFFTDDKARQTDKMFCGRISEGIKVGERYGKAIYEFEAWNARFVGKALDKARTLTDKTSIRLTEWSVHNPYSKELKKSFPYILVTGFEVVEKSNDTVNDTEDLPFD